MLVEIPLTDDERAAVEGDERAVTGLIDRLSDIATPAGPTPRQLTGPAASDHSIGTADKASQRPI